MNLENIRLSERSYSSNTTHMKVQNREVYRDRKQISSYLELGGGRVWGILGWQLKSTKFLLKVMRMLKN